MNARPRAAGLIRAVLVGGPRTAGDVIARLSADSISEATTRRAARDIGVIRTRDGAHIRWALPATQTTRTGSDGTAPAPVTASTGSLTASAVPVGAPTVAPAGTSACSSAGAAPTDPPDTESGSSKENDMTVSDDQGSRYVEAVADGLTLFGRVLVRGDVVELPARGTPAWEATTDRSGASFLDDLSPAEQYRRWGAVHLLACSAPVTIPAEVTDPATATRREPIRPTALPATAAPLNRRWTPEGSVPMLAGLGGTGPVSIVDDRRLD